MTVSLYGDIIVACLLLATIGYAAVLNRRLGAMRNDRAKLDELIKGLAAATARAEAGIAGLKSGAVDLGRQLEKRIEQAEGLKDDLAYMLDRGGAMADRLEQALRAKPEPKPEPKPEAKPRAAEPRLRAEPPKPAAKPAAVSQPAPPQQPIAASRAERDLLRALAALR